MLTNISHWCAIIRTPQDMVGLRVTPKTIYSQIPKRKITRQQQQQQQQQQQNIRGEKHDYNRTIAIVMVTIQIDTRLILPLLEILYKKISPHHHS